ncbi:vacuolar protein-sorting-associated protein 25-like [Branchiostoma floridae]|uniref:Vacuolar protein-sorting-associated protein 25 n=1 Tax=Branchiostoma floridae TaxID=7739 RepID=C3YYU3_BRAFL|nr:vacuolar protein-sorting-associated protein 25-like [Branchiostoma floridae]|eukprot:XP_002598439.1 hypothetical protein BRAFLDRAFT_59235 [Branchiostoma floridae]
MAEFQWPWQYNFPPFFTIQPNKDTQAKQLEAWCLLVLSYCRHRRQYSLDVTDAQDSPLFHNKKIDRKLPLDAVYTVLEELRKKGNIEWTDPKKRNRCLIMWRTPEEWGKIIYQWVTSNGMNNTVCTTYELVNGDDTTSQEFHGMESWLLTRALQTLQLERKAELMGSEGVKFF